MSWLNAAKELAKNACQERPLLYVRKRLRPFWPDIYRQTDATSRAMIALQRLAFLAPCFLACPSLPSAHGAPLLACMLDGQHEMALLKDGQSKWLKIGYSLLGIPTDTRNLDGLMMMGRGEK